MARVHPCSSILVELYITCLRLMLKVVIIKLLECRRQGQKELQEGHGDVVHSGRMI